MVLRNFGCLPKAVDGASAAGVRKGSREETAERETKRLDWADGMQEAARL
jgi:hypothetical protein